MARLTPPVLAGKRVLVMGLGRFGGGVGVTRYLVDRGADVLVTDLDPEAKLADSLAALREPIATGQVTLRLGEHNVSDFTTADLVIANPAVPRPWDNRFLRAAQAARIPIDTEIGLALAELDARGLAHRTIAITGTAGKSTTSALIHHILTRAGHHTILAGNIGASLLTTLDALTHDTWVILELSSFQLYWIRQSLAHWTPRVGVATNIAPNHLDWHGSMEHYTVSKQSLFHAMDTRSAAVLDESLADWPVAAARRVVVPAGAGVTGLAIPGRHNQHNAALAVAAVEALAIQGLDHTHAADHTRCFQGLPHRLQRVAIAGGVEFFNDSKSTTPDATLLAIDTLAESKPDMGPRLHLIVGGYDKGSDLAPMAHAWPRLAGIYTIGATGPALAQLFAAAGCPQERIHPCERLDAAVPRAFARAADGHAIVLSPGCASWDQFINYEQRGERFVAIARAQAAASEAVPGTTA